MDRNIIKTNVIRIVKENINSLEDDFFDIKLGELAIESVEFIRLVVEFEDFFGFEFDDEDLDYNRFIYFQDICDYIDEKIS